MDLSILAVSLGAISLCFVLILVYLWRLEERLSMLVRLVTGGDFLESQSRAYGLLHRAGKVAQSILGRAELSSVKVIAQSKWRTKRLADSLEKEITDSASLVEKTFLSEAGKANDEFRAYLTNLRTETSRVSETVITEEKEKVDKSVVEFHESVAKLVATLGAELHEGVVAQIDLTKKEVDDYKKSRMAEIDSEALNIIEEATAYVLSKKLSLSDQMDLIFDALDKAKAEKLVA